MNILVLGGNGFIGSHVVKHLLARGHQVRVFDRHPVNQNLLLSEVDYRVGDFSNVFMISEALFGIDLVCHLISTTVPSTSNLDPVEDIRSNLINTIGLLEQMKAKEIKRIIYLSSGGTVYGIPETLPIHESHPLNPICSYGVVKVAIEKYLYMYQRLYEFNPLILRPSNPYGPGQKAFGVQGVIGTFLGKVLERKPLEVWGDGEVIRDYIYIADLANCVVSAIESQSTGAFNVGGGQGSSVKQIISLIRNVASEDVQINYHHARPYDVPEVVLDIGKAKRMFDWCPRVDLQQGLRKHYEWIST